MPALGHADFFLRIPNEAAADAAAALRPAHHGRTGGPTTDDGRTGLAEDAASGDDPTIDTTPTGAAGLAGLIWCAERPALRERLGLDFAG